MRTYGVITEWKYKDIEMVTVNTPGGCSVMEKKEWNKLFGRLHPELWENGKKIRRKHSFVA